jgi:hypothetical protein
MAWFICMLRLYNILWTSFWCRIIVNMLGAKNSICPIWEQCRPRSASADWKNVSHGLNIIFTTNTISNGAVHCDWLIFGLQVDACYKLNGFSTGIMFSPVLKVRGMLLECYLCSIIHYNIFHASRYNESMHVISWCHSMFSIGMTMLGEHIKHHILHKI